MGDIEDVKDGGGQGQAQDPSQVELGRVASPTSDDDDAIIPKGQIDPVYEAKARVLNHAARRRLLS